MKFSRVDPYRRGDFVVIYRRPELVKPGGFQAAVKRLVFAPPPFVKFPWRENPRSEVRALVGLEQLNPARSWWVPCDELLAIHKCLGVAKNEELRFPIREARHG